MKALAPSVLLDRSNDAYEYEEMVIDRGNAIMADMQMDISGDYLYVMSSTQIHKVKVENCTRYNNCSSCIGVRDPYCGWCSLERR
uniref:Sema domain-containing protein n=1 Tax=Strigamia maritima TaxID=126957 RepID=T1IZB9_STRMM